MAQGSLANLPSTRQKNTPTCSQQGLAGKAGRDVATPQQWRLGGRGGPAPSTHQPLRQREQLQQQAQLPAEVYPGCVHQQEGVQASQDPACLADLPAIVQGIAEHYAGVKLVV